MGQPVRHVTPSQPRRQAQRGRPSPTSTSPRTGRHALPNLVHNGICQRFCCRRSTASPCGMLPTVWSCSGAIANARDMPPDALGCAERVVQCRTGTRTRAGCQKAVRSDSRKSASFSGVLDHVGCYVLPVDILRERTLRADSPAFSAPFADDRQDDMTPIRSQTL